MTRIPFTARLLTFGATALVAFAVFSGKGCLEWFSDRAGPTATALRTVQTPPATGNCSQEPISPTTAAETTSQLTTGIPGRDADSGNPQIRHLIDNFFG